MNPSPATPQPAPAPGAAHPLQLSPELRRVVARFEPLTLKELNNVALLNRTDTKYLLTERQMVEILQEVQPSYRTLEIKGLRAAHYVSQYYDTPELAMYLQHHNGARDRLKVRRRTYVDSGIAFLEVKRKTNRDRTIKTRIEIDPGAGLEGAGAAFLRTQVPFAPEALVETTRNEFLRVSMAGKEATERLTIDFAISFEWKGLRATLPGLVIAEVKQPRFSTHSSMVQALRARHIAPLSFSKYCLGVVLLDPTARYNLFKQRLFQMQHLLRDYLDGRNTEPVSGRLLPPHQVEGGAPLVATDVGGYRARFA